MRICDICLCDYSQPLIPCASAVVIPLPPLAIHRISFMEECRIRSNKNYPQIAPIIESKIDKIKLTNDQIKHSIILLSKLIVVQ